MEIEIEIDVGSSNPFAQEITDRIAIASTNFYKPQNLYIHAVAKKSKNPPTTINIKGVDSQSFFAVFELLQEKSAAFSAPTEVPEIILTFLSRPYSSSASQTPTS